MAGTVSQIYDHKGEAGVNDFKWSVTSERPALAFVGYLSDELPRMDEVQDLLISFGISWAVLQPVLNIFPLNFLRNVDMNLFCALRLSVSLREGDEIRTSV